MSASEADTVWAVREWRYEQARELGLSQVEATLFAEDSQAAVHELRRLVDAGCPPKLAFRIVRD